MKNIHKDTRSIHMKIRLTLIIVFQMIAGESIMIGKLRLLSGLHWIANLFHKNPSLNHKIKGMKINQKNNLTLLLEKQSPKAHPNQLLKPKKCKDTHPKTFFKPAKNLIWNTSRKWKALISLKTTQSCMIYKISLEFQWKITKQCTKWMGLNKSGQSSSKRKYFTGNLCSQGWRKSKG